VSVLQHHNHATRDVVYVDPAFTKDAVATMHVDTTFASATYTGPVTAHPLYLAGAGSVPDLVIVGTNQNHVFAFNAATGAKVWDQAVGTPLPQSNLAGLKPGGNCGNVNPLGVMGTPVIDGGARTIYLGAMQLNGGTAQHMVYALDADTGMPRSGWPVDLNAKAKSGALAFTSLAQNQRGALALVGGRVLVPFGGHIGDCGDYHGWVVSISAADPTQVSSFATRAIGGGIWAHGALASDGTSVYFATGNTMSVANMFSAPGMYGDGESVFKLPPDLTMTGATTEYFVPTNWAALDNGDTDIGGTGPLPIDLPGSTPSKAILQFGKDGKAYLIDRDMMGGQSAPSAVATVTSGQRAAIITAPVVYTTPTATYAVIKSNAAAGCPAGQTGTLRAVKITTGAPPTMEVAWCSGATSAGAPAVTMTSASGADTLVWLIGDDNKLRAHDGDTGAVVFNGGADTMAAGSPFRAPIFVNGRAFAASNTQVYALKP
jgi:outer membrane protein assembly factor BamB